MGTYRKISEFMEVVINDYDEELWDKIPKDQIKRVFKQKICDLSHDFLGFTETYFHLSKIVPKHFTIVDLGCAYNPQCFYFDQHKKYIAVDLNLKDKNGIVKTERFQSDNCEIYEMDIKEFIAEHLDKLDLEETFAICSYVPAWGQDNMELVRKAFKNVYTYYPHGGWRPTLTLKK